MKKTLAVLLAVSMLLTLAAAVIYLFFHISLEAWLGAIISAVIEVISNRHVPDTVFREKLFRIIAGLSHITAQAGKVFGNHGVYKALFQLPHHFLKTRPVEVSSRPAVICEESDNINAIAITVICNHSSLRCNT